MPERKSKAGKKPHLKLIQGGKSTKKPVPKAAPPKILAQEKPTKRVHPFAHFFEKSNVMGTPKPNFREQGLSHQIPRKKAF